MPDLGALCPGPPLQCCHREIGVQPSGLGMMQDHGVEPQPGPLPRSGPGCQQGMLESGLRQGPGQQLHPTGSP